MAETKVVRPSRLKSVWRAAFGLMDPGLPRMEPTLWGGKIVSGSTSARKLVTPETSLQLSTIWACVRLISETVGTLPLILYQSGSDGSRTVAVGDPLYSLLHDAPHADYTAVEFWEGVVLSLCLWGNAYARKEFMGERLVALTPLRCDLMGVRRDRFGAREYLYSDPKGRKVYTEDEVFHVRGFGGAGDVGLSPISFARQSLSTAMAAEEQAGAQFANGVRIDGFLQTDITLDADQRKQFKENIVAPYQGSGNAGGLMLLEGGFKFVPGSFSPEDSQFLQTRSFHVEDLCRWYRMPPGLIGHTEKSSSLPTAWEGQMISFNTLTLRPYLQRIEQAISRALIPAAKRGQFKAEFVVEGLLRADSEARSKFYQIMVQNGLMTRNEVRRLENLPPLGGGDQLTVQAQNVPLGEWTAPKQLPPPKKD